MNKRNYLKKQRDSLIKILQKDITDPKVLQALEEIPREEFFHPSFKQYSYINAPFNIGFGQTISQPLIVGLMTQLLQLKKTDKVLDIGTGSGYQAAILCKICKEVVSIEMIEDLYKSAKSRLKDLGYKNIKCVLGNGIKGYKRESPYDKILCAASYPKIPPKWLKQLKNNGIIVFPLKKGSQQQLVKITKKGEIINIQNHGAVVFVPLVNKRKQ
jgi:protein-L-isoaspartate(D-aspartate) O-methyltransferase